MYNLSNDYYFHFRQDSFSYTTLIYNDKSYTHAVDTATSHILLRDDKSSRNSSFVTVSYLSSMRSMHVFFFCLNILLLFSYVKSFSLPLLSVYYLNLF